MKENEYLLYKQTINGNKKISKDVLTPLFKKKPNRHVLGTTPYLYAYFVGRSKLDTAKTNRKKEKLIRSYATKLGKIDTTGLSPKKKAKKLRKIERIKIRRDKKLDKINLKLKEGNWMMRSVGEPPSVYDTSSTNYNLRQIRFYLNSKGYFLNKVTAKIDTQKRRIFETYTIVEGSPYTLKSIEYEVADTAISRVLQINSKAVMVKEGENYDEDKLSQERDRINRLLKENGYYDFNTQYVLIDIDSTLGGRQMAVRIVVRNPPNQAAHPRYTIRKIVFNTDISRNAEEIKDTVFFNGIYFIYSKNNFSKKILSQKVRMHAGEYYIQSKIQLTQRQLAALDMYKFININFDKITSDTAKNGLVANIRTSELKKFQTTEEAGVNITSAGFVPGPFGSISFKNRNLFRGFEIFETNLRASILGQAAVLDPTNVYRSEEYNANVSLSFPQFFFPTKLRFKMEDYSPKTKFIAGYTLVRRPEYVRGTLQTSMNYIFSKGQFTQYTFALFDINYINTPHKSDAFNAYLIDLKNRGNNLVNSFGKSIVTDINASYVFNNNQLGSNKMSRYMKFYAESGGTTLNLIRNIPVVKESFISGTDSLKWAKGLKTFRYFKLTTDFRFYFPVHKKNTFAMRFTAGYARAYDAQHILPYEKYFFMGGSNSMRAWQTRRLGPGNFVNVDTISQPGKAIYYKFEQPGEVMFEMNYEYRFKIIGFFDGAAFVDAGNLWSLHRDSSRPGAEFILNKFYNQLAVGTGLGLRLNFSFLILRLDLAVKAVDPAQPGSNFVLLRSGYKDPRLNIGIGYPF